MKITMKQARCKPSGPFIQIAQHDFIPGKMSTSQNVFTKKPVGLMTALEKRCAEMNVEHVQQSAVRQTKISSQTSPRLTSTDGNVVVMGVVERIAGEQNISVSTAVVSTIFAKFHVEAESFRNVASLVIFRTLAMVGDNFLQSNDVRVELAQDSDDAIRPDAAVYSAGFMDIVSDQTQPGC